MTSDVQCVSTDQQEVEVVVTLRELLQFALPPPKFGDFHLQLVDHRLVFLSGLSELLVDVQLQFGLRLVYATHQGIEELIAVVNLSLCFVLRINKKWTISRLQYRFILKV